jgi:cell division protease FtsH
MSSGAQMDISQATKIVRSMVCEWGMTDALGTVALDERAEGGQYLGVQSYQEKNYSDETAKIIDQEVKKLLDEAHQKATNLIENHRDKVQLMTDMLIEFETLDREDVLAIMDGSWDIEKKKAKLKMTETMHIKLPPPPPSVVTKDAGPSISDNPTPQQI